MQISPVPRSTQSQKPLSPSAAKLRLLKKLRCTLRFEKKAWATGAHLVAGVDEVGRELRGVASVEAVGFTMLC